MICLVFCLLIWAQTTLGRRYTCPHVVNGLITGHINPGSDYVDDEITKTDITVYSSITLEVPKRYSISRVLVLFRLFPTLDYPVSFQGNGAAARRNGKRLGSDECARRQGVRHTE